MWSGRWPLCVEAELQFGGGRGVGAGDRVEGGSPRLGAGGSVAGLGDRLPYGVAEPGLLGRVAAVLAGRVGQRGGLDVGWASVGAGRPAQLRRVQPAAWGEPPVNPGPAGRRVRGLAPPVRLVRTRTAVRRLGPVGAASRAG